MSLHDTHTQEADYNLSYEQKDRFNTNVLFQKYFDEIKLFLKEKYPEEFV